MPELTVRPLLVGDTLHIREVCCAGTCRHRGAEETVTHASLALTTRGVFVRHVGNEDAIAEANQLSLFSPDQPYRVSHPVAGGDECLAFEPEAETMQAMLPRAERPGERVRFAGARRPLRANDQRDAIALRHALVAGSVDALEAETRGLDLVARWVSRDVRPVRAGPTTRRLVSRARLWLAANLRTRASLATIARDVGATPVYLTQAFAALEHEPLYRYQRRLRLAQALRRLHDVEDLSALALDCGFNSHSHFSAAFRQTFGVTPSAVRRGAHDRRELLKILTARSAVDC
jgi:AraC family transcriptional regulator